MSQHDTPQAAHLLSMHPGKAHGRQEGQGRLQKVAEDIFGCIEKGGHPRRAQGERGPPQDTQRGTGTTPNHPKGQGLHKHLRAGQAVLGTKGQAKEGYKRRAFLCLFPLLFVIAVAVKLALVVVK